MQLQALLHFLPRWIHVLQIYQLSKIWFARTSPMLLKTEEFYPEFKSTQLYLLFFFFFLSPCTRVKELCLQLGKLICIKMPQTLQQSFQKPTDTIPHNTMSSGISKNSNTRGDVNGFI